MYDVLVNHALQNVWCTPNQDLQVVFEPARISPNGGVRGTAMVIWDTIPLPTTTDLYHVYQIGQVSPALLNLLPTQGVWRLLAEHMKSDSLMGDIYTIDGIQLPRIETWILVNRDKNVILAVKDQLPTVDLNVFDVFLRLYSNAFFESLRASGQPNAIDIYGARITSAAQALTLQQKFNTFQSKVGLTTAFVNGYIVDIFNPFTVKVGDVVEFVYDSTVTRVVEFPINTLQSFTSTLDGKFKYLLHYPGVGDGTIDFCDDIDVYLIKRTAGSVPGYQGVYYHKNALDSMRNLTHKDYSVCVPYIEGYASAVPIFGNSSALTVRLHVREAGYDRPLVKEASRIMDLYRLPDVELVQAMVGVNATVPVWQAASLENAAYPAIMDAWPASAVTIDLVQAAYGYDAMAKILGDTPQPVVTEGSVKVATLPPGLQSNSTIYEYDTNGYLLGYYPHAVGTTWQAINPTCALIEGIVGNGTQNLTTVHDAATVTLDPTIDYRFYICPQTNGVETGSWIDVTGDDTKYVVNNGVATWLVSPSAYTTQVRNNTNFLAYQYTMTPADGLLKFSFTATETYAGVVINAVLPIPVGQLDLWLNGRAIIEGLDYLVNWPEVCIFNTAYLLYNTDGSLAPQVVTVRGTGFCNANLTRDPSPDVGFVEYGVLSRNNKFNVRDDKVLRIVVNGAVYPRSALEFSEDNPSVGMSVVPNGSPYVIADVVVPLRANTDTDTYTLRTSDLAVNAAVENYLTLKLPDAVETVGDVIPNLYAIYSPFTAKVLYDLLDGVLLMTDFQGQYSDMDVKNFLASYAYLLEYEPTELKLDTNHVIVYPHNRQTVILLNIYQYNFLNRAVAVFLNGAVNLSHFVGILPNYI
jgi:hypothetical protein